MAKRYQLARVEREKGEPLANLIPRLVNEHRSQKAAAEELGVAPSTISSWLRDNDYIAVTQWVKQGQPCNNNGAA